MTETHDQQPLGARSAEEDGAQLIPFPTEVRNPAMRPDPTPAPAPSTPDTVDGETIPELTRRQWATAIRLDRGEGPTPRIALPKPVRVVARATYTVAHGHLSWGRRALDALTHAPLREQVRLARLTGDREALAEWTERLVNAKDTRHARLRNLPVTLLSGLHALGMLLCVLGVLLVLLGAWVTVTGLSSWSGWWHGLYLLARDATAAGEWFTWFLLWCALPALLITAHREGKRRGDPPRWLLTADERALIGAEITPSKVVLALRDAGIPALRKYIVAADDGGAGMLGPIAIAGPGVEVDVKFPSGVDTGQLEARRRRLAENLDRHEHELYMSVPAPRTVRFWIAEPGALDQPIGPSPLVTDHPVKANAKTGRAPLGQNLRSDRVGVSLWQRHVLITGISNHGKTAVLRALALWLAFDPHVEFRIADLKGFGDWNMFGPLAAGQPGLAAHYISGPADEHVIAATEMLEAGIVEMNQRLESGRDDGNTVILLVDEAQKAYMCPVKDKQGRPYGGQSAKSRFFMAARTLHNQGRAVNVVLWQGTQDPTDENLPTIVREGAHIRMSLVVGTASQSKMALGEAAVNGGAAPHLLRQDIDKGVVVMHGGVELPRGGTSLTVRTYFIDTPEATEVAKRAIERRRKAGSVPHIIEGNVITVDHLADIHAAMRGEKRVRTVVVLGRLIEDNASVYEPWGFDDLASAVREYAHLGLDVRKYGGDSVLRLEEVEQALARRE